VPSEQRATEDAAREIGVEEPSGRIPRLPGTRVEAEEILSLVPPTERKQALDFSASRAAATSEELAQYRIIHFATHGFLNSVHPELSGIVLSMYDERGTPQDGYLRSHEIFNLRLSSDLVVLSACQTGLGKEVRGEGLVGLTRGFMYAGSPRVVVSLWNVSDEATAELMSDFYQGMLKDKLTPAAALRSAQLQMWRQKRWQSPYYWAAFTLQGEWR
jgi:CHAT domain-containing protein